MFLLDYSLFFKSFIYSLFPWTRLDYSDRSSLFMIKQWKMIVSPLEGESPIFHEWFAGSWHSSLGAPWCEPQSAPPGQPQPDPQQIERTPWVTVDSRGRCTAVSKTTYLGCFPAGVYKELPERSKACKVQFKWMKMSAQATAHSGGRNIAWTTCNDHDIATSHCASGFPRVSLSVRAACFASHDGKRDGFYSSLSIFAFCPHEGTLSKKKAIQKFNSNNSF